MATSGNEMQIWWKGEVAAAKIGGERTMEVESGKGWGQLVATSSATVGGSQGRKLEFGREGVSCWRRTRRRASSEVPT